MVFVSVVIIVFRVAVPVRLDDITVIWFVVIFAVTPDLLFERSFFMSCWERLVVTPDVARVLVDDIFILLPLFNDAEENF